MSDDGSCVTLIFYRINPKWWKEPALNLASAVAQMSNLTHCEISLGEVRNASSNSNPALASLAKGHCRCTRDRRWPSSHLCLHRLRVATARP